MTSATSVTSPSQHFRTCHLCEAMCGVVIEHRGPEILSIKGDKEDPFSQGHICPKAVALKDLQEDPDRLRRPLKRVGQEWVEISWEQAYGEVEAGLRRVQQHYGRDAVATYIGNPTAHNTGALLMLAPLLAVLGTRNRFSATSVDQLANMLANLQMFGHQGLFPVPDLDRTDFLLMLGANPAASNGSIMSAGNVMQRIGDISRRGGRVLVLDPRHSESAAKADEHWFIRPGSDVFFLAGLIHVLFADGLVRLRHLSGMTSDVEPLRQAVQMFTPEAVAEMTGIAAAKIRQLAHDFAAAERAVCYGRIGTSVQEFGGLSTWLIYCVNVLTGNLDRAGGFMFTHPAIDLVGMSAGVAAVRGSFDTYRSRGRGLPEFGGELPVAVLAEEIMTPGPGQIRALITHAGNPVLSTPNGRQLDTALAGLDFMVAIDIYLNETTRHAHIILPPSGPLEHGHFDLALNLVSVRNVVKYSPPLLPMPDYARHDWQIMLELVVRLQARNAVERRVLRGVQAAVEKLGMEGLLDWLLKSGPYGLRAPNLGPLDHLLHDFLMGRPAAEPGRLARLLQKTGSVQATLQNIFSGRRQGLSMQSLRQSPHGMDLGPLQPALPARLCTPDRRIALSPAVFLHDLERARARLAEGVDRDSFLMIGRRHVRSNNSWLHNSHRLVKGKNRCTVMLNPEDAGRLGVAEGEILRVVSRVGAIELPAEITADLMPGVISVPHGFGHHRSGIQLGVASRAAGVSMNDITDEQAVDKLTGVAVLNGLPVRLELVPQVAPQQKLDLVAAE